MSGIISEMAKNTGFRMMNKENPNHGPDGKFTSGEGSDSHIHDAAHQKLTEAGWKSQGISHETGWGEKTGGTPHETYTNDSRPGEFITVYSDKKDYGGAMWQHRVPGEMNAVAGGTTSKKYGLPSLDAHLSSLK
jgi:hypothetical protein